MRLPIPLLLVAVVATSGCASLAETPQGRAHQAALASKAFVDGSGEVYLAVCKEEVRPRCVDADKAATAAGTPQTQEDRVACLGPCGSAVAATVQKHTGYVVTAQLFVWRLLATDAPVAELEKAERELRIAITALLEEMRKGGVDELLTGGRDG